ncbi:MAG: flippase-like domain-containing protein [Planctomycetes bacterium]|nr:flippase-like domain-containing protein [Planctomycetota bacterium]
MSPSAEDSTPSASRARFILQMIGFVLSLALLWWCVRLAFTPENQSRLTALSRAPVGQVVLLFSLSAASLLLNGAMFWATLLPVRRLGFIDTQSVNSIAGLLSYLPFKLSIVARLFIHNRRDKLPLLTIGAWMVAVAGVLAASLVPTVLAAVWRQKADALFFLAAFGGMAITYALTLSIARIFAHESGLERLRAFADGLGSDWISRLLGSARFRRLHVGLDMLASPASFALAMILRVADLLVQAARFTVAAQCLGESLPLDTAVLAASTFYLIGVLSPSGALGAREGVTTGLAGLLAVPGVSRAAFAPIALTVSATEVLVNLSAAALGAAWLRVWNILGPIDQARSPGRDHP